MEITLTELRFDLLQSAPILVVDALLRDKEYLQFEADLFKTFKDWEEEAKTNTNTKLLKRKYNKLILWKQKEFLPPILKRVMTTVEIDNL